MIVNKLGKFNILLYKNFLVRKRHWYTLVEILIPLIFIILWFVHFSLNDTNVKEVINKNNTKSKYYVYPVQKSDYYFPSYNDTNNPNKLLIVPDNQFTQQLEKHLEKCYPGKINRYSSVDEMTKIYLTHKKSSNNRSNNRFNNDNKDTLALIFTEKNINLTTKNVKYIIQTERPIPQLTYASLITDEKDVFDTSFTGLQLCVDKSLIKMKNNNDSLNDFNLNIDITTKRMPQEKEKSKNSEYTLHAVCAFAVAAFLIPLCIETLHVSSEKFRGVNILMALNGVPNYLNLFSWLVTGLIFSLLYIVPIVCIVAYAPSANNNHLLEYGNSFIVWFVLTLNISHLITFGMHFSAYFTRSLLLIPGLIIVYVVSILWIKFGISRQSYVIISYLGILFPNILLYRFCEEIYFYEIIKQGISWNNLFQVTNRAYGIEGSVGIMILFSIAGMILNFLLANYVSAINPGKYGVKKSPFYFLKFLKNIGNSKNYSEVEDLEFSDTKIRAFEPVPGRTCSSSIVIRDLKKSYKTSFFNKERVHALQGISIDIYQGNITALLGYNGAGKTTMMSILSGLISSTKGLVLVNGKNVKSQTDEMNDIGLCPQKNIIFSQLSVFEQVKFLAMLQCKNKSQSMIDSDVTQLLKQLKLFDERNSIPKYLSDGHKRRVCLAMALVGDADTLILDEPTSGLEAESKRDIWNILLKMRGLKTILISTQDMEEADVLADRIAIIHDGQIKSYGTPNFLKRFLGSEKVEVTLSTESWCDPENIRSLLDAQTTVKSDDHGKLIVRIPFNDELPDTLDKIEEKKKELGIIKMTVSMITLEKVFHKLTQDNDDQSESRLPINVSNKNLGGIQQLLHTWKALLAKKATYTLKNWSTPITIFILLMAALLATILILKDPSPLEEELPINLKMYRNEEVFYKVNHRFGFRYLYRYRDIIDESFGSRSKGVSNDTSFDEFFRELARKDSTRYNYHALMGAEFKTNEGYYGVEAIAFYNPVKARFAQPISINLLSNAMLKTVVDDNVSIEISIKEFPNIHEPYNNVHYYMDNAMNYGSIIALILAFLIYPAVALFVVHPIRESLTKVKHLQRITGVSGLTYWGTMFLFDFLLFFLMSLLFVIGLIVGDFIFDLRMFAFKQFFVQLGLFTLFAVNILPLVYTMSFWKNSTVAAIRLLSIVPLILTLVELVMSRAAYSFPQNSLFDQLKLTYRGIIFLLSPYVSFFQGQLDFFRTAKVNADCVKFAKYNSPKVSSLSKDHHLFSSKENVCYNMTCHGSSCTEAIPYFKGFDKDISLDISFLALALTSILYFGILLIFEFQLFEKLMARSRQVVKIKNGNESNETTTARFQMIPENDVDRQCILQNDRDPKDHLFFVNKLRKILKKLTSVQDVSECFGLLGLDAAAKSITSKMIVGQIISDDGVTLLDEKTDGNVSKQIGYCPQNQAVIKSLNAYDHLHLFARLRGISEDKVEDEVENWIDQLGLKACALLPSSTYSDGNIKRLNVAMALIGRPKLVLLDEPTSGVDSVTRQTLWNIIKTSKSMGQAVILTSHSMKECEALCNQLAIMVNGKFVYVGSSDKLEHFGTAYEIRLKLSCESLEDEIDKIKQNFKDILPGGIITENSGSLLYHVSTNNVTWRRMHDMMKELKIKYRSIEDYFVLSSTIERQLLVSFSKAADKN